MNYLDSLRFDNFENNTGVHLESQIINIVRFYDTPQTTVFPKMPVPAKLWFEWTNSRIDFDIEHRTPMPKDYEPPRLKLPDKITHQKFTIFVPRVDKIVNEYIKEQLPVVYTLKAMRFDSARSGYKSSTSESEKAGIGYGLDILKALKKESAGEVNLQYEKQWEKAFSFYINPANINELEQESRQIIEKYNVLISNVEYIYTEKPGTLGTLVRVGDEVTTDFITKVNKQIVEKIDKHFRDLEKQMEPFDKLK